ncbi:hypothetical protein IFO69_17495 [Echinicola sp. CAU 1574]|uniref:Uncharacterized protein n=1 Tax=Echinicola arenosa TaxID=2774144 RepID=A0ABR9AQC5_9BACT|nr:MULTISPECIES: hypothetical protein [Echinicola]MBD8490551.1 hypothetical protein [Echinicola arenosa]
METGFTLLMLTFVYGLCLLSFYPEKYFKKISYKYSHQEAPDYKKFRFSEPFFFSFLGGYLLAFTVVLLMF